ncbi:2Fe-2S iron-sulfur cluster-binding protein [Nocardia sp. NPDC059691]|uniref:2Fe-2S iron-sulfur cluster-binding protein n=1 Tax=Nocardia sp. NPDC059691 TaxID=3346908 RepID=UPI00369629F8
MKHPLTERCDGSADIRRKIEDRILHRRDHAAATRQVVDTFRALLDGLEDNGIRPEVACRSRECSWCRIRVVTGSANLAEEARLLLPDSQFGDTHSCVACPSTDVDLGMHSAPLCIEAREQ